MSQTASSAPPPLSALASRAQSLLPRWAAATGMDAARSERFISVASSLADTHQTLLSNATDADRLAFRVELSNAYPCALGEKPSLLRNVPTEYDKNQISKGASEALDDFKQAMSEFQADFENIDVNDPGHQALLSETAGILTDALALSCSPHAASGDPSAHSAQGTGMSSGRFSSEGHSSGARSSGEYSGGSYRGAGSSSDHSRRTPSSLPHSRDSWSSSSGSAGGPPCGSSAWSSNPGSSAFTPARTASAY
ncbi:hypothetical protein IAU59_003963 [Kwoniella sp. CBS 9459]